MRLHSRADTSGHTNTQRFERRLLPIMLTAALASTQAQAVEFNLGEIEGRFDSQISVGASWRVEGADSNLISPVNGGTSKGAGSYDDATQNFMKGDTFSQIVKGVHDLELRYENVGAFVRGKYWYDAELNDGKRPHGNTGNSYNAGEELDDSGFNDYAKFSGAEILDAYLYGEFELGDKPLDVRVGRQVVNWGESTFIQGGINGINAFDVNAFRRAGAEVKEGLLPSNMAFASLGVTDNLSIEGFYQIKWEPTAIDGCGTYFSTNDFTAQGCNGIRIDSGALGNLDDEAYFGFAPNVVVQRDSNGRREADDDGQFGFAFRYFAEELNDTEFGFYYSRYHSRLPIASGIFDVGNPVLSTLNSRYFVEYPEDIQMFGLSFNTMLGDIAWSGEYSYKKDAPMQINGTSLVQGILTGGATGNTALDAYITAVPGTEIDGYQTFDISQFQTSLISFHDRVLGASRLALIGELGWTHVHGLDEGADQLKYGRSGAFGYTAGDNDGFVTQDSFGYVLRASLTYPDAFAGVNLKPEVSFKHGVHGFGPEPGAAFREGEKSLSLSLTGDYLNTYSVQLSYTNFFGGDYNAIEDRDFIALSGSISF